MRPWLLMFLACVAILMTPMASAADGVGIMTFTIGVDPVLGITPGLSFPVESNFNQEIVYETVTPNGPSYSLACYLDGIAFVRYDGGIDYVAYGGYSTSGLGLQNLVSGSTSIPGNTQEVPVYTRAPFFMGNDDRVMEACQAHADLQKSNGLKARAAARNSFISSIATLSTASLSVETGLIGISFSGTGPGAAVGGGQTCSLNVDGTGSGNIDIGGSFGGPVGFVSANGSCKTTAENDLQTLSDLRTQVLADLATLDQLIRSILSQEK